MVQVCKTSCRLLCFGTVDQLWAFKPAGSLYEWIGRIVEQLHEWRWGGDIMHIHAAGFLRMRDLTA